MRRALPWFLESGNLAGAASRFAGETPRPVLVIDFETTNRQKGWVGDKHNRMVCASWCPSFGPYANTIHTCYADEFHQKALHDALDYIRDNKGVVVAHNAKFEAGWVARMGFDPTSVLWWDTLLAEYVQAGNRKWALSLDAVAQRYDCEPKDLLGDRMMKNGVCPSAMPEKLLVERNRKDVSDTLTVFRQQQDAMPAEQIRILFTRGLSVPILADVEQQGVAVDEAAVDEAIRNAEAEYLRLMDQWFEFRREHIEDRLLPDWMKGKEINLASSDHVAWILYKALGAPELRKPNGEVRRNKATKRWPGGKPLANDKALSVLKLETLAQREFVKLRKDIARVKAELSKTLYFFKGVCLDYDGVFYGQFNQSVTQTHRLSSSGRPLLMRDGKMRGIQFQNMPRKFLSLLKAKRGKLGSHDAAQIEFRVAVELGDDAAGRANIAQGVDQHKQTAAVLLNKPADRVTDEERQHAKSDTFKPLYGGRKGTEAQMRYYAEFRRWFPGIASTQEGWTEEVLATGKLVLPWGMTFYWPGTKISRDGYIDNTPSIYNYPIQSLATAEIVPVAVVYLWHRLRHESPSSKIVNMVHDSAVAELSDTCGPSEWLALGRQAFGPDVYNYMREVYGMDWKTTLGLGTKYGKEKEVKSELTLGEE